MGKVDKQIRKTARNDAGTGKAACCLYIILNGNRATQVNTPTNTSINTSTDIITSIEDLRLELIYEMSTVPYFFY